MIADWGGIQEGNQTNHCCHQTPQFPQINMPQCGFLMCGDVLTDTVHLRVIRGNASHPRGDPHDAASKKCWF